VIGGSLCVLVIALSVYYARRWRNILV
jgi:hypothetical protein